MASKRKRANRDHRAISLKGARTRTLMAMARKVSREAEPTDHALREQARARRLVHLALGGAE